MKLATTIFTIMGFGLFIGLLIGIAIFAYRSATSSTIKGQIIYTALKPSAGDKGEVRLYYREFGTSADFKDAGISIPLNNEETYTWSKATKGKNYELQAALKIDDEIVSRSEIQTVTAPAFNTDLSLKVLWQDLPHDVVAGSAIPIGGDVTVNGYIPPGSTIQIFSSAPNSTAKGQQIAEIETINEVNQWQWADAVPLQQYVLHATLQDKNGKDLGDSDETLTVQAAESEVNFVIDSLATPPATPTPTPTPTPQPSASATPAPSAPPSTSGTVNGIVYINGPMDANTSLLMLWRKPGDANYQTINRYPMPSNEGAIWQWTGATVGQQYEIMAVLQVNGNNTSEAAQSQIISAPANNINFTINTNFLIPTPTAQVINNSCFNQNGNTWTAQLVMPTQSIAQNYWLQVGTAIGRNDVYDGKFKVNLGGTPPTVNVTVNNGQTYYAWFAQAACYNCSDDHNFSPFSPVQGFTCG